MGSRSAPIGTTVVCQVHELDQQVGPHAARGPTSVLIHMLVNGLNSGVDHKPVVKIFTADAAATWLFTESDPDDPDRLFGLCDLGLGAPELGYASLTELLAIRGYLGLPVQRDMHFAASKPPS